MEFPKVAITSPDAPLERWRSWIERADFAVDGQDLPMVLLHNDFAAEHVLIDPATQRAAGPDAQCRRLGCTDFVLRALPSSKQKCRRGCVRVIG